MNRPMILPWIARRAGISDKHAESLWSEALALARKTAGPTEDSEFWEAAETYLHEGIKREQNGLRELRLTTPEFSSMVRLQMRAAHLPLLAWEGWSLAWMRLLSTR